MAARGTHLTGLWGGPVGSHTVKALLSLYSSPAVPTPPWPFQAVMPGTGVGHPSGNSGLLPFSVLCISPPRLLGADYKRSRKGLGKGRSIWGCQI